MGLFESRHQEVLAAFRTGDPDAAAAAVRRHILRKLEDVDRGTTEVAELE
jgi:DNA-binding GntR family transcriptional regulator